MTVDVQSFMHTMPGDQIAAEAAKAATYGGTAHGALAVREMAKLTPELRHGRFQSLVAKVCLASLQLFEQKAREFIGLTLQAISDGDADLVLDACWTLHMLCKRCDFARQWILEADGISVIRHSIVTHAGHRRIPPCAAWILHKLAGLGGLTGILSSSGCAADANANLAFDDIIVSSTVWVIYDVFREDCKRGKQLPAETPVLLRLILGHLSHRPDNKEVVEACCKLLEVIVKQDADAGKAFVNLGGTPLIVQALSKAASWSCDNLIHACAGIFAVIVHGSSEMRVVVFQQGAVDTLLSLSMRGRGTTAEEKAMFVFGQLAGLQRVVEAMQQAPTLPALVRGGLSVIPELVSQARESNELQQLPGLLEGLLKLRIDAESPCPVVKCKGRCLVAICSVICCLTAYAEPGQVAVLDKAVLIFVKDLSSELSDDSGHMIENVLETLGRVALVSSPWHEWLCSEGIPDALRMMVRRCDGRGRLVKYCFWCAAAISGLPFVVEELRLNMDRALVVDAAFCSMSDILDDDVEGDWALKGAEKCSEAGVGCLLSLVAEAMRKHTDQRLLQSRGCHCNSLLFCLVPPGAVPYESVSVVLVAVRLHGYDRIVVREAFAALRALLELSIRAHNTYDVLVKYWREEGVPAIVDKALRDFMDMNEPDLLEDAVMLLCVLDGMNFALQRLLKTRSMGIRTNGVKALFELGRLKPCIIDGNAAEVKKAVAVLLEEYRGQIELERNAQLLVGLCDYLTSQVSAFVPT